MRELYAPILIDAFLVQPLVLQGIERETLDYLRAFIIEDEVQAVIQTSQQDAVRLQDTVAFLPDMEHVFDIAVRYRMEDEVEAIVVEWQALGHVIPE